LAGGLSSRCSSRMNVASSMTAALTRCGHLAVVHLAPWFS
jgi:hypothetical protein